MHNTQKPTLLSVKQQTGHSTITTNRLADLTGLSLGDVYTIEVGGFTTLEKASKVVSAFAQLSGIKLSVNDIRVLCVIR